MRWRGRRLVYFGGCDYYRLAQHPTLLKAHSRAAARDGLGTGASRMTTGNHPSHSELESALVKFFGSETATVVGNGYLANLALALRLGVNRTRSMLSLFTAAATASDGAHFS